MRLGILTWTWMRAPQSVGLDLAAEAEAVWGDEAGGLAPEPLDRWASAVGGEEAARHGQDYEAAPDERRQRGNPASAARLLEHPAPHAAYPVTTRQAARSPQERDQTWELPDHRRRRPPLPHPTCLWKGWGSPLQSRRNP